MWRRSPSGCRVGRERPAWATYGYFSFGRSIVYVFIGLEISGRPSPREIVFKLEGVLIRLMSPPEEQVGWLRRTQKGIPTAEPLVQSFKTQMNAVPNLRIQGIVTQRQAETLYAVDRKLSWMGANLTPERWLEPDLRESPDWVDVRALAAAAREALAGGAEA